MIVIKKGNIFDSPYPIVHQCNCVTANSAFLARDIFDRYPFANTYKDRKIPTTPGTIDVLQGSKSGKIIVNIYSQYYPGKANYSSDNSSKRLEWFKMGLKELEEYGFETISVPYKIGCGSAGGNWDEYFEALKEFSLSGTKVVIYKLN